MKMQKTAMQELIEWLDIYKTSSVLNNPSLKLGLALAQEKATTFLQKEKQQVIEAYNDGIENHENASIKKSASEYFKENFGR